MNEIITKIATSHQKQMSSVHPHAIIGTIEDAIEEALKNEKLVKLFSSNLPVMRPLPTITQIWDRFPKGSDVDKRVGANWVVSVMSA